jgi:hypothetical protein
VSWASSDTAATRATRAACALRLPASCRPIAYTGVDLPIHWAVERIAIWWVGTRELFADRCGSRVGTRAGFVLRPRAENASAALAEELAKYERLARGTNRFLDFVANATA